MIDADARRRILEYQRIAATEGRVVFQGDPGPLADQGYFVGPMIVADVPPGARIAQEEIFGPVLAVLKAKDLDDALRIANGTAVRPDRRPLFAQPGQHRAGPPRVPRRQSLHQPRDHRGPGRPPAVRRVQALGHRHQGRRARLPARVPADPLRHREHDAPGVRAGGWGCGRDHSEYQLILKTVQRVAPFLHDFHLEPFRRNPKGIKLEWIHKSSDDYFDASALSDGTLRFICLSTLFLQPLAYRPSVILVDEPELGLHPYAITMLANLIKTAAAKTQIIIATQSALLLDHFRRKAGSWLGFFIHFPLLAARRQVGLAPD